MVTYAAGRPANPGESRCCGLHCRWGSDQATAIGCPTPAPKLTLQSNNAGEGVTSRSTRTHQPWRVWAKIYWPFFWGTDVLFLSFKHRRVPSTSSLSAWLLHEEDPQRNRGRAKLSPKEVNQTTSMWKQQLHAGCQDPGIEAAGIWAVSKIRIPWTTYLPNLLKPILWLESHLIPFVLFNWFISWFHSTCELWLNLEWKGVDHIRWPRFVMALPSLADTRCGL